MPEPNSKNTVKGKSFQTIAAEVLRHYFLVGFQTEHPILIGNPPKSHKFDLVSDDGNFIGECKNYSWTEGGFVPSAKMGFINEAVFYLQHISSPGFHVAKSVKLQNLVYSPTIGKYKGFLN